MENYHIIQNENYLSLPRSIRNLCNHLTDKHAYLILNSGNLVEQLRQLDHKLLTMRRFHRVAGSGVLLVFGYYFFGLVNHIQESF